MSRTLEPGVSLLTASEIRVVVVAIGPMPRDTFDHYLDAFNLHRHVPLAGTRSFHQAGPKSPFQHLPYKTGAMHFRFMQTEEARRRSRIVELHASRAVVAVLGLLHCPLVEDLAAAHAEFERAARQWPEALVAHCCAFEPSPQHLAAATAKKPDIMMFPAGHLEQHLDVYMHEFAAAVLAAIEDTVLNSSADSVKLNTYVDSGEFMGPMAQIEEGLRKLNTNEEDVTKKKRLGRLQKATGDWALMAGSPRDAFEHYKSAVELSKASGDAIWCGAAVEGLAHARVLEALVAARPSAGGTSNRAQQQQLGAAADGSRPSSPAPAAVAAAAAAGGGSDPEAAAAAADKGAQSGATANYALQADSSSEGATPAAAQTPPAAAAAAADKSLPSSPTRGTSSTSASAGSSSYSLSGPAVWAVLARAELQGEVVELMAEARGWYKKRGGAVVLQIEQALKLARLCAGLYGCSAAARAEASDAVGLIIESLPVLLLPEDRLTALTEAAARAGGLLPQRLLLLWAALDIARGGAAAAAAAAAGAAGAAGGAAADGGSNRPALLPAAADASSILKLAVKGLEPPERPRQQDPDDLPRVHWSLKHFIAWQLRHMAAAQQQQQSQRPAAADSSNSSQPSTDPATQQTQTQQQVFQQLLGQHLQLLSPTQAASLQRYLVSGQPALTQPDAAAADARQHQSSASSAVAGPANPAIGWISPWDSVEVALLEAVVSAAKVANAPVEAWEAAAALLRDCYPLLPQALQVALMEALAAAGGAMGSRARQRPGPGPGPQVQLKRVLPGPQFLQPLHLGDAASAGAGRPSSAAAAAGPFIFNPYAAKRQGASAAAAAEAALPEWVCGDEGLVEVLLVNPCAAPLRLEQLQLVVQPLPAQQQQSVQQPQQQPVQQQLQRRVSVSLAAGSKPVRVLLGFTAARPGYVAVTGVQASCWGVSWYQPLVCLPLLTAAAAGPEAIRPQGAFTVVVQPPLPLIKACVQGPDVQLVVPSAEEIAASAPPSATSGSSTTGSGQQQQQQPFGGSSTSSSSTFGPAGGAGGGGVGDLDKKTTSVFVLEGQTLSWTLHLTNVSSQPVTACKVTVLNSKGAIIKPLLPAAAAAAGAAAAASSQQQLQLQLPPSFSGAHMEVHQEQCLASGLPLNPGASLALPVSVVVGKPPGDAFDSVLLQVRITYHGGATSTSSSGQIVGRQLTLPLRLAIQPTLQVQGIRFLQQTLPLLNGQRSIKPRLLAHHQQQQQHRLAVGAAADAAGSSSSSAAASGGGTFVPGSPSAAQSSLLRTRSSLHTRNSSDGAVPAVAAAAAAQGLTAAGVLGGLAAGAAAAAAAATAAPGSPSRQSSQPGLGVLPVVSGSAGAAAFAAAEGSSHSSQQQQQQQQQQLALDVKGVAAGSSGVQAAGALSVGSEPVLELCVRNASDRYFRAWLGCLPDRLGADSALSVVAVLEPGDNHKLLAVLPESAATAAAAGAASSPPTGSSNSSSSSNSLAEPSRLSCAEGLARRVLVCWEMITGAAAAGQLPHGRVQLSPVDLAATLSPGAFAALAPSPLQLRLSAAASGAGGGGPGELVDLTARLAAAAGGSGGSSGGGSSSAASAAGAGPADKASAATVRLPGLSGPLYGLHMKVGQWLPLDCEVACIGSSSDGGGGAAAEQQPLQLLVSLYAADLLGSVAAAGDAAAGTADLATLHGSGSSGSWTPQPGTPATATAAAAASRRQLGLADQGFLARSSSTSGGPAAAAAGDAADEGRGRRGLMDPGVFVAGCYDKLLLSVQPGSKVAQRLQVLLVQPGLYQFGVADVRRAAAVDGDAGGSADGRVYFNQAKMYVLVSW